MAVSALSAAKRVCELSGWQLSNLSLQKILYIAHLIYLGRRNEPLFDETFQAWNYGPVLPSVYHKAKIFGSDPVRNVFHSVPNLEEGPEADVLAETVEKLSNKSPSQLVAITHWDKGAWAKHYMPGMNMVIPNDDVLREYQDRYPQ